MVCSHVEPGAVVLYPHILSYSLPRMFQNKFYIESKLNRDLRDDLMKLFADHVAEKHVNTLMRECMKLWFLLLM